MTHLQTISSSDVRSSASYKLVLFFNRHPDLDRETFAGSLLALERREPVTASGLLGYTVTLFDGGGAKLTDEPRYDAAIETWWARKNDAANWLVSREFESSWLAARRNVIADRPVGVGGEPKVALDRKATDANAVVQLFVLPTALRSLRFDQFEAIWTEDHTDIALSGPDSRQRIVRFEDTPSRNEPPSRLRAARHDGVGVIEFESREALEAEFASDYYRDRIAPEALKFSDRDSSVVLVGRPHRVV